MDVKGVEAFKLSDVGILTLAKQSGCFVYLDASTRQTIPNNTITKCTFSDEQFDVQNEFDPVTNNRFTAKEAGKYMIFAGLTYWSPTDQGWYRTRIHKNGAFYNQAINHASGTNDLSVLFVCPVELNANDYLEVYAWHLSGAAKDIGIKSFMSIFKVT